MPTSRTRSWWIFGAVLTVVAIAALTVVVFVNRRSAVGQPQSAPPLGLPAQELLSSSMRNEPVPGWRTSSYELGLPPGTVPKLIRNFGDRGFFLGIAGTGWWLAGIDVASGRSAFPPVELGLAVNASGIDCFVNGPATVLCVLQDRDPQTPAHAWSVDTDSGALLYDGPTPLRLSTTTKEPVVEQRGDYAVATVNGVGVHGIGAQGELTWFVPGNGIIAQPKDWEHDSAAQPLAVQGGADSSTTDAVFSVVDGRVVTPTGPSGVLFGKAMVYPGGFAYEYSSAGNVFSDQVAFFGVSGKRLGQPNFKAKILTGSRDVPMLQTPSADVVMTLDGQKLLELPKSTAMPYTRLIGEVLLIDAGGERERSWRQYDLRTGKSGKTCNVEGLGYYYIATDGNVALISGDGAAARAIDLDSCDQLWSLPGETQSEGKDVWRVNTTLVERVNDELFSLVAPR